MKKLPQNQHFPVVPFALLQPTRCEKKLPVKVSIHRILGYTPLEPDVKWISFPCNAYFVQGYKHVMPVTVGRPLMLARYQTPPIHAHDNRKISGLSQGIKEPDGHHGIEGFGWCALFLRKHSIYLLSKGRVPCCKRLRSSLFV